MDSNRVFKHNVKARLRHLGIAPYRAAVSNGKPPSWLTGILNPNRHKSKVSSVVIDETAHCLGVRPHDLIDPDFDPTAHAAPPWLVREKTSDETAHG